MPKINKKASLIEDDDLNMTPLIDCVFLLLIFFMVTTVFKNPAKLDLALPEASSAKAMEKGQIVVELDAEGQIAMNSEAITYDQFDAYLVNEKKKSGSSTLLIKADKNAKHGNVLRLMMLAKEVDIETVAMAVDNPPEEE